MKNSIIQFAKNEGISLELLNIKVSKFMERNDALVNYFEYLEEQEEKRILEEQDNDGFINQVAQYVDIVDVQGNKDTDYIRFLKMIPKVNRDLYIEMVSTNVWFGLRTKPAKSRVKELQFYIYNPAYLIE